MSKRKGTNRRQPKKPPKKQPKKQSISNAPRVIEERLVSIVSVLFNGYVANNIFRKVLILYA